MKPYENKAEFQAILSALWSRIFSTKEILDSLSGVELTAKFRFTDFETELVIDVRSHPPAYCWDPENPAPADVEMILSSETSHRFWMEDLSVPMAIARRQIVAKGSIQKALKLMPALKPAFALYPPVLRDMGKGALLDAGETAAAPRRRFRIFPRLRRKRVRIDRLPLFPLDACSGIPPQPASAIPAEGPSRAIRGKVPDDTDLLRTMYRIRFFEEHLAEAFRKGELPTEAIHLSIGQEGVAAGVCRQLRETDYLNTTHRGHGHIIAKGADLNKIMAEIYGKASGSCGGKGGSMHVTDGGIGILGANGIVGAGYLLALGAGFTISRTGRDDVSVVIAGDGSVNQGMFHEAMNMMAVFSLPVLVVVENNRYGEFTAIERHSAVTDVYRRAASYGVPARRADAGDVRAVGRIVSEELQAIRAQKGPRLLELMTYRWHGHMEGDPETYRDRTEKEIHRQNDPIAYIQRQMLAEGSIDAAGIDRMAASVHEEIAAAVSFALNAEPPDPEDLMRHVYVAEPPERFGNGIEPPEAHGPTTDMSMAQAVNTALGEEMTRDDTVFLWGEDVTLGGYFNVTEGLVDRFGSSRIIDTPISENAIVGGAVGAAMTGMNPVAEILFSDFLTCCMDPIVNQAAKLRYMTGGQVSVPLTIRTPVGSGIGMAAQHSQAMERFFYGVPGLIVVAPSDPYTAKGLLKSAIRSRNPVLFVEHKLLYAVSGKVPTGDYQLPFGKARRLRAGRDVTIVSHLLGVGVAMDAAETLAQKGISVEVIDLVTLYPMDTQTILDSVAGTGRLVTLEEGCATGGIGAEVIARVSCAGLALMKCPPMRIAAPECPIPYAKNLETAMMPDPDDVARRVMEMF